MTKVYWDRDAMPRGTTLARILYGIQLEDKEGFLLDSVTIQDIHSFADEVIAMDALLTPYNRLQKKMEIMMRTLQRVSKKDFTVTNMEISSPFKKNNAVQVAVLFTLTDGQTISIFFHNPDATPSKLAPQDVLVSWKWLLNKRDITLLVAPEHGTDINMNEIARRVIKIAEKNRANFARAQARSALKAEDMAQKKAEAASMEKEIQTLMTEFNELRKDREDLEVKAQDDKRKFLAKAEETEKYLLSIQNGTNTDSPEVKKEKMAYALKNFKQVGKIMAILAGLKALSMVPGTAYYLANKKELDEFFDEHKGEFPTDPRPPFLRSINAETSPAQGLAPVPRLVKASLETEGAPVPETYSDMGDEGIGEGYPEIPEGPFPYPKQTPLDTIMKGAGMVYNHAASIYDKYFKDIVKEISAKYQEYREAIIAGGAQAKEKILSWIEYANLYIKEHMAELEQKYNEFLKTLGDLGSEAKATVLSWADFSKQYLDEKADALLKAYHDTVASITSAVTELADKIPSAGEVYDKYLKDTVEEINAKYQQYRQEIIELGTEAQGKIQSWTEFANNYIKDNAALLQSKYDEVIKALGELSAEAKAQILSWNDFFTTYMSDKADQLMKLYGETSAAVVAMANDVISKIPSWNQFYDHYLKDNVEQLGNKFNDYRQSITEFGTKLGDKVPSWEEFYKQNLEGNIETLNAKYQEYKNMISALATEYAQKAQGSWEEFYNSFLKDKLAELSAKFDDYQKVAESFFALLKEKLAEFIEYIQSNVTEFLDKHGNAIPWEEFYENYIKEPFEDIVHKASAFLFMVGFTSKFFEVGSDIQDGVDWLNGNLDKALKNIWSALKTNVDAEAYVFARIPSKDDDVSDLDPGIFGPKGIQEGAEEIDPKIIINPYELPIPKEKESEAPAEQEEYKPVQPKADEYPEDGNPKNAGEMDDPEQNEEYFQNFSDDELKEMFKDKSSEGEPSAIPPNFNEMEDPEKGEELAEQVEELSQPAEEASFFEERITGTPEEITEILQEGSEGVLPEIVPKDPDAVPAPEEEPATPSYSKDLTFEDTPEGRAGAKDLLNNIVEGKHADSEDQVEQIYETFKDSEDDMMQTLIKGATSVLATGAKIAAARALGIGVAKLAGLAMAAL